MFVATLLVGMETVVILRYVFLVYRYIGIRESALGSKG